jgi:hypothetical protein
MSDNLTIDGNAAAGLLQEVFPFEMTSVTVTCDGCGANGTLGALPVYEHGPGTVVRCPHCDAVQLRVVRDAGRYWIELRGVRCLEIRA